MSTTLHLPTASRASAHRALIVVLSVALAVAVAVAVTLLISRSSGTDPSVPGLGSVSSIEDGCFHAVPGTAC